MSWRAPAATLLAATTLFLACERRAPSEGPAEILIHSSPRESSELFVDTGDLECIRGRGTLRVLVTAATTESLRRSATALGAEELAVSFAARLARTRFLPGSFAAPLRLLYVTAETPAAPRGSRRKASRCRALG